MKIIMMTQLAFLAYLVVTVQGLDLTGYKNLDIWQINWKNTPNRSSFKVEDFDRKITKETSGTDRVIAQTNCISCVKSAAGKKWNITLDVGDQKVNETIFGISTKYDSKNPGKYVIGAKIGGNGTFIFGDWTGRSATYTMPGVKMYRVVITVDKEKGNVHLTGIDFWGT